MLVVPVCCGHWLVKIDIRGQLRRWFVESPRLLMRWVKLVRWDNTLRKKYRNWGSKNILKYLNILTKRCNVLTLLLFLPGLIPIWRPSLWNIARRASSTILILLHIFMEGWSSYIWRPIIQIFLGKCYKIHPSMYKSFLCPLLAVSNFIILDQAY